MVDGGTDRRGLRSATLDTAGAAVVVGVVAVVAVTEEASRVAVGADAVVAPAVNHPRTGLATIDESPAAATTEERPAWTATVPPPRDKEAGGR